MSAAYQPRHARHRAQPAHSRPIQALRRPAVAATFALSAFAASAGGYAATSGRQSAEVAPVTVEQTYAQRAVAQYALYESSGQLDRDRASTDAAKQAADRAQADRQAAAQQAAKVRAVAQKAASDKAAAHKAAKDKAAAQKADVQRAAVQRAAVQQAAEDKVAAEHAAQEAKRVHKAAEQARARDEAASRSSVRTAPVATGGSPQAIAHGMLSSFGWSGDQFGCLNSLWNKESGWRTTAANPSGAYGIPQALPGSKMASAGSDWRSNPATQVRWGLGYIKGSYGSPCAAWGHSRATNWY